MPVPPMQVLQASRGASAPAYNPLTAITWHTAYWASDAGWVNPGNGNNVTSWRDGSGNSRDATTRNGTPPVFRSSTAALNGKPTVEFNVGTLARDLAGANISHPLTKVLIFKHSALSGIGQHVMSCYGVANRGSDFNWDQAANQWGLYGGSSVLLATATPDTNPHCFFVFASGASSTIKMDGTLYGSGINIGSNTTDGWVLGGIATFPQLVGHIAFAGVLARALTAPEEAALLAWSRSFYGTP